MVEGQAGAFATAGRVDEGDGATGPPRSAHEVLDELVHYRGPASPRPRLPNVYLTRPDAPACRHGHPFPDNLGRYERSRQHSLRRRAARTSADHYLC